jgi:hypothetical protein
VSASQAQVARQPGETSPQPHRRRLARAISLAAAALLLTIGGNFVAVHWPYRYREVHPLLEAVFGSQVKIAHYHRTYFPHPGFMAADITITRKSAPNQPALGTVHSLFVQGNWIDLFLLRRRVRLVSMTGLHIVVPAIGSNAISEDFPPGSASGFGGPQTTIEVLRIHDSLLEVQHDNGKSFRFPIRELEIKGLQNGQPMHYTVDMQNAIPHGHITASGSFGPLNPKDVGMTGLSGQFTFTSVQLHDVGDIHGTLSSRGQFSGSFQAIQAAATAQSADFAVDDGHAIPVSAEIHCTINGVTGDVLMHRIEVSSGRTSIQAHGQVAGSPKVANIDLSIERGRAEDVLRPFMKADVPVTGPVTVQSHAYVGPSGKGKEFLQRLRVDGRFDLPAGRLTDHDTEQSVSAFSQRAQSKRPSGSHADPLTGDLSTADHSSGSGPAQGSPDVLSSLQGPAAIRNGVISTPGLLYKVPGAQTLLSGTFALHGQVVHLTGDLAMQTDVSHTATGFKAALLKPLAPFFKKHHEGAVIPIAVIGSPGHYKVTQNLSHHK